MGNEMESGVIWGLYRDPSIQIAPTLGPNVCKYDLHQTIWIPRANASFEAFASRRSALWASSCPSSPR